MSLKIVKDAIKKIWQLEIKARTERIEHKRISYISKQSDILLNAISVLCNTYSDAFVSEKFIHILNFMESSMNLEGMKKFYFINKELKNV